MLKLFRDRSNQLVVNDLAHILVFVVISDGYVASVLNQFNNLSLAKCFRLDGESLGENISNVILEDPKKRLVVIQVKRFHVFEANLLAQNSLVDGSAEMAVKNTTFVQSLANHATNKLEEQ